MLNPDLDVPALADEFRRKRRILIRNIFVPEAAERIHDCLAHEVPWGFAYIDGDKPALIQAPQLLRFTSADWLKLHEKLHNSTADKFQFAYNSYMMVTAYRERRDPDLLLHAVVEYINSPPFLDFLKSVTGATNIIKADAQATRYIAGHFLKKHNDVVFEQGREVAYVLNFTKQWQADWGGLLNFLSETGEVTEVFPPSFNSLALFRVPMWHCVSYVAPYARGARYAITGWGMSR